MSSIFRPTFFIGGALLGVLILSSCSSSKKKIQNPSINASALELEKESLKPESSRPVGPSRQDQKGLRFENQTSTYGLMDLAATSLALVDYNHDGHEDLVAIENYLSAPIFYLWNVKNKRFERDHNPPLESGELVSLVVFADMDNDGHEDMITARFNQRQDLGQAPIRLYLAKKVQKKWAFQEVSNAFNLTNPPVTSVSVADFNGDGFLDVFATLWYGQQGDTSKALADQVFLGLGNGHFKAQGPPLGEDGPSLGRPSMGSSICDLDGNGRSN